MYNLICGFLLLTMSITMTNVLFNLGLQKDQPHWLNYLWKKERIPVKALNSSWHAASCSQQTFCVQIFVKITEIDFNFYSSAFCYLMYFHTTILTTHWNHIYLFKRHYECLYYVWLNKISPYHVFGTGNFFVEVKINFSYFYKDLDTKSLLWKKCTYVTKYSRCDSGISFIR
jgi:hypothetical protein